MLNFKKWLFESSERDVSSLIEDAVGLDSVIDVLNNNEISHKVVDFNGTNVIVLPKSNIVIHDFDDGYGTADDVGDFIYSRYAEDLKKHVDFNKHFWSYPVVLYNATTEENLELIKSSGVLKGMCKTRGLGNRGVGCAVFTSMNHEDLMGGSYGNVILDINTRAMKSDGYMPTVSREPEVEETIATQNLVHSLGLHYDVDYPHDVFLDTVIVHGSIPIKYISHS